MTKARIQPFCGANKINLGYFDGERVLPRSVTERNNALYFYNNHFCLIWKSQGIKFNHAAKELKDNFKIVDNYITEEKINSHFKYEILPKKVQSHLTSFIVYDLETHNTDRARPYNMTFYRLGKIADRYERDFTQEQFRKSINDTLSFIGDNCIGNVLDLLLKFKGEKKVINKIVEYNLKLHAHNSRCFDTWIILNNLPCDKQFVDFIKNGKDIISLERFNYYIEKK